MICLSKKQIIKLHKNLIDVFGGSFGIRNENLLDLSINSIHQTFDGNDLYIGIIQKSVHLCFSLVSNHAFIDGNKRIGTHALLITLELNGYIIEYEDEELINIILDIASSTKTEDDLLEWVNSHIIK